MEWDAATILRRYFLQYISLPELGTGRGPRSGTRPRRLSGRGRVQKSPQASGSGRGRVRDVGVGSGSGKENIEVIGVGSGSGTGLFPGKVEKRDEVTILSIYPSIMKTKRLKTKLGTVFRTTLVQNSLN